MYGDLSEGSLKALRTVPNALELLCCRKAEGVELDL
jgi:hypothetical protein